MALNPVRKAKWISWAIMGGFVAPGMMVLAQAHGTSRKQEAGQAATSLASQQSRNEIRDTQRKLDAKGYAAGPADGIYGQKTAQALRAFQRDHNVPITGHLDERTLSALGVPGAHEQAGTVATGNQQAGTTAPGEKQSGSSGVSQSNRQGSSGSGGMSGGY